MRWVEAVKLWNVDTKKVSTKDAYAIPRKGTNEYKSVKSIMEGKPEIKKVMEKRAEQVAPKEVMASHIMKKEVSHPKTNNNTDVDTDARSKKDIEALNEYIMYKSKWNKASDNAKHYAINHYKVFSNSRLHKHLKHLVLPASEHIKKFAEEENYDLTTPY
jgi:hypothetical protein